MQTGENADEKKSRGMPRPFTSQGQAAYQMITRSFGARYILSPCFTPKAS
jgi:hypothetical protein